MANQLLDVMLQPKPLQTLKSGAQYTIMFFFGFDQAPCVDDL